MPSRGDAFASLDNCKISTFPVLTKGKGKEYEAIDIALLFCIGHIWASFGQLLTAKSLLKQPGQSQASLKEKLPNANYGALEFDISLD